MELVGSGPNDALVAVAQSGDKDARQAVEIPASLPILQPHAFTAHEHPRLCGESGHLAKVQHQMVEHVPLTGHARCRRGAGHHFRACAHTLAKPVEATPSSGRNFSTARVRSSSNSSRGLPSTNSPKFKVSIVEKVKPGQIIHKGC